MLSHTTLAEAIVEAAEREVDMTEVTSGEDVASALTALDLAEAYLRHLPAPARYHERIRRCVTRLTGAERAAA